MCCILSHLMSRDYTEIAIEADELLSEQLTGILSQLGIEGFWEDNGVLRCYIRAERWTPALETELGRVIRLIFRGNGSAQPSFTVTRTEDRDWNELWEQSLRPIGVTDRITIAPSWHPVTPREGAIVLTIDPRMAFGTGHHETTRLCLRLLERYVPPAGRVLDVGTGTGILAIAAVKLGAAYALGIDVDEWACSNAAENSRFNNVGHTVEVHQGSLQSAPPGTFLLVLANIQLDVILELLDDMIPRLEEKGTVIFSGILHHDVPALQAALFSRGLKPIEALEEGEWAAIAARKGS